MKFIKFLNISVLLILTSTAALFAADFVDPPSGWFFIKSVQPGNADAGYWDQPGTPRRYERGGNLQVYAIDRGFNNDQQFRFIDAGGGWYHIQPRNGGLVDVSRGHSSNGTNVLIWDGNKSNNQKFRFEHLGEGRYKIHAYHGGILCLAGRSHEHRTNIHIWTNHEGSFTEWRFENPSNRQVYVPPKPGFQGQLIARNIDAQGRSRDTSPGVTEVEVWVYRPKEYPDPYILAEVIKTDAQGRFTIDAGIYGEENSMRFISRHEDRSSGFAIIHPKQKITRITDFISYQYDDPNYVLTTTPYRGKRYYVLGDDDTFYLADGVITKRDDFYFPDINERNKWVGLLLDTALPGMDLSPTDDDEIIRQRMTAIFAFIAENTRSSMNRDDEKAKEAAEALFEKCRARPRSPLRRWPTLTEYGNVFFYHGFIPWGNCTAKAQFTASLMMAAGINPDRFFVSKFNYDQSWLVEHWVIALNLGGTWNSLDPINSSIIKNGTLSDFAQGKFNPPVSDTYDWQHPFEAYLPPGSSLTKVPFVGNDSVLRQEIAKRNTPEFFINYPVLDYRSGGMAFSSTGTAEVVKVEGNTATVKITATTKMEGPNGWEERTSERTIEISVQNGVYSYIPDPDYPYTGTVSSDGERLSISGMQSGMTFSVPK